MSSCFNCLSPQNRVLFYDGSEKGSIEAKENAKILSEALGGRKVTILYNPKVTGLDPEEFECNWAFALAKKLIRYARFSKGITLFVYGPDAELIEFSLINLKEKDREKITTHSFGANALISNGNSLRVTNHVYRYEKAEVVQGYRLEYFTLRLFDGPFDENGFSAYQPIIHQLSEEEDL